jgi:hypothetical protein
MTTFWNPAGSGLRMPVAIFDTKLATPRWLPGSAGRRAAKLLKRLGIAVEVAPESFYVRTSLGPLIDGELARARQWGDWVARLAVRDARAVGAHLR